MSNTINLIVVLIVLTVIIQSYFSNKRKYILNKLSDMVQNARFEEFEKYVNKKTTMLFVPDFDLNYLKLNVAMAKIEITEILKILNKIESKNLNTKQKKLIYPLCINYFLSIDNKELTKEYYEKLIKVKNVENKEYYDMLFDTYVNEGYMYLDSLEEEYKKDKANETLLILIEKMKKNKEKCK